MTPATYRKRGKGAVIDFAIADSPLGRLLVGATERGICAVSLGSGDKALEDWLRQEYSAATIRRDDARLGAWIAAILAHLDGKAPDLSLPLDLQATGFQWRVWGGPQESPPGTAAGLRASARPIGPPPPGGRPAHTPAPPPPPP